MTPWDIFDLVLDAIIYLSNWRFTICFFGGIALAVIFATRISTSPLNLIAAGITVIAGFIIGWRWDRSH